MGGPNRRVAKKWWFKKEWLKKRMVQKEGKVQKGVVKKKGGSQKKKKDGTKGWFAHRGGSHKEGGFNKMVSRILDFLSVFTSDF